MLNFNRHYLSNRAPFNLRFRASWFENPMHLYAFNVSRTCRSSSLSPFADKNRDYHVCASESEIRRRSSSAGRRILRNESSSSGMDAQTNPSKRDERLCTLAMQRSTLWAIRDGLRAAQQLQTVRQGSAILSISAYVLRVSETISVVKKRIWHRMKRMGRIRSEGVPSNYSSRVLTDRANRTMRCNVS
jgi:hypothetical protein